MGIPVHGPAQPSPYEHIFSGIVVSIKPGSASAPNTELTLDYGVYWLMLPFLVKYRDRHRDNSRIAVSHFILAARNARSSPSSEAYALMTDHIFCALRNICKDDLNRWDQKACEMILDGDELWDYSCSTEGSKLGMLKNNPSI